MLKWLTETNVLNWGTVGFYPSFNNLHHPVNGGFWGINLKSGTNTTPHKTEEATEVSVASSVSKVSIVLQTQVTIVRRFTLIIGSCTISEQK